MLVQNWLNTAWASFVGTAVLCVVLSCACAHGQTQPNLPIAQATPDAAGLQVAVQQYLAAYPDVDVSVAIQDTERGTPIVARRVHHLWTPASTLKLVTATAAVLVLGPDFTFTTALLAQPHTQKAGVLTGDVVLRFTGDPSLTAQDLKKLFGRLTELNIHKIAGRLLIDDQAFDQHPYGPGWMWDELNLCYASPLSAIMIDKNCFTVTLTPGSEEGAPTQVQQHSPIHIRLFNHVTTHTPVSDACALDAQVSALNTYTLAGCLMPDAPPKHLTFAIKNIHQFTRQLLEHIIKDGQLEVTDGIHFIAPTPTPHWVPIAQHHSPHLRTLIKTMLKTSDNLIADTLYKRVAHQLGGQPASWQNSGHLIQQRLTEQLHMDWTRSRMVDGSGLSRYNLISAAQLQALLNKIAHHPTLRATLWPALPIAGVDGTLSHRLTETNTRGCVQAKTGTMTGTTALAGYLTTRRLHHLHFVIAFHDFVQPASHFEAITDKLLDILIQQG